MQLSLPNKVWLLLSGILVLAALGSGLAVLWSVGEPDASVSRWIEIGLVMATGLVGALMWFVVRLVFLPLRRLADEALRHARPQAGAAPLDELQALSLYLDTLKAEVRDARSHLAQTRDHLLDAEKLAAVGRLAAGVAHEIRSPLTSLKLRLFSMQKALGEGPRFQTDIQAMSDEITRLDTIIRNFLDFSRPPAIQVGRHDICLLLEKTVDLLHYRINASRLKLELDAAHDLPPALVDGQQLRQVFINLLNNAVDALPPGRPDRPDRRPGERWRRTPDDRRARARQRTGHSGQDPRPRVRSIRQHEEGRCRPRPLDCAAHRGRAQGAP